MMQAIRTSSRTALLATRQMVCPPALPFYVETLRALKDGKIPFVVGGAFALRHYAGIARGTKDLDVFLRPRDLDRALGALEARGLRTETTFPHWLAKARWDEHFVDLIFNSANGLCPVDDDWFRTAPTSRVLGVTVKLCPIEEVIWTKSFVMERERFDGADICHLIEAKGDTIDWPRLLSRYGANWRVLLGHLVFYSFVYPSERGNVPPEVMDDLLARMRSERAAEDIGVCMGTLVSREQYLVDLRERGYGDARVPPWGPVTPADIGTWTDAIGKIK